MEQAVSRALTFPKDFPSAEEIPQPGTSEPLQRQAGFKSWMSSPAQAASAAERIRRQASPFHPGSSRESLFPPGFPFIRHPNDGKDFVGRGVSGAIQADGSGPFSLLHRSGSLFQCLNRFITRRQDSCFAIRLLPCAAWSGPVTQ